VAERCQRCWGALSRSRSVTHLAVDCAWPAPPADGSAVSDRTGGDKLIDHHSPKGGKKERPMGSSGVESCVILNIHIYIKYIHTVCISIIYLIAPTTFY